MLCTRMQVNRSRSCKEYQCVVERLDAHELASAWSVRVPLALGRALACVVFDEKRLSRKLELRLCNLSSKSMCTCAQKMGSSYLSSIYGRL